MKLTCQKAFLIFAVSTLGCSDPLTPRSVSGVYLLESVNGQSLPATLFPPPEQHTSVIYGSVTLTADAKALTVERRQEVRQNVPTERTIMGNYPFVLDGNRIGFIIDCGPNANCISLEGIISGEVLTIALGGFDSPNRIIYEYRFAPNIGAFDPIIASN